MYNWKEKLKNLNLFYSSQKKSFNVETPVTENNFDINKRNRELAEASVPFNDRKTLTDNELEEKLESMDKRKTIESYDSESLVFKSANEHPPRISAIEKNEKEIQESSEPPKYNLGDMNGYKYASEEQLKTNDKYANRKSNTGLDDTASFKSVKNLISDDIEMKDFDSVEASKPKPNTDNREPDISSSKIEFNTSSDIEDSSSNLASMIRKSNIPLFGSTPKINE